MTSLSTSSDYINLSTSDYIDWLTEKKTIDIDKVDAIYLDNITRTTLSINKITIKKLFNNLTVFNNLKKLFITNCTIEKIPNSIGNLTKLTQLHLTNNNLNEIPNSIGNLINLTDLRIINNKLTKLPDTFGNLTNLTILDLGHNSLTLFPNIISNLTNLQTLDINNNNLNEIPNSIGNLTNLIYLILTNNNINEIPNSIGNLTKLTQLNLSNNNLNEIPNSIGNLINLKDLRIENNNLNEIPNNIGNLTNLTHLILTNNNLDEIPNSIGNLTKLTHLFISNNQLITLPNSIINLVSLEELDLDDNTLHNTNPEIRGFLREFGVEFNNNNQVPFINPFQVHQAFDKINTQALFTFMKPLLSDNVNSISNKNREDFINYMGDTLEEFIDLMPNNNSRKKVAETDIYNIFGEVLNNILYTPEYKKIISYCLDYVSKQSNEFKMTYVSNFTYDCAHAYNSPNGNVRGELSCARGMIERFVFSLVPAAMLFIDTPIFTEKGYDKLIAIIENKPKTVRQLMDEYAKDCYEEASNSEDDFKKCLKKKLQEKLGNSYNEETVSKELDEYVPLLGLFGGFRKRRVMKTRKHKSKSQRQRQKMTKIRKMKKTLHKSRRYVKK